MDIIQNTVVTEKSMYIYNVFTGLFKLKLYVSIQWPHTEEQCNIILHVRLKVKFI